MGCHDCVSEQLRGVFPGGQLWAADENSGIAGSRVWWGLRDEGGLWREEGGGGAPGRKMEVPSGAEG